MVTIYTDMGKRDDIVTVAYLMLSENEFIGSDVKVVDCETSNTTELELYAILCALEDLEKIGIPAGTTVTVVTDSWNAYSMLCSETNRSSLYITSIQGLAKQYDLQYKYIKSHANARNPNVIVDSMCSMLIKEVTTK